MNTSIWSTSPTPGDIHRIDHGTLKSRRQELARHVTGVIICVEEFPDTGTEQNLDLESPFNLPGLYQGTPLQEKSIRTITTGPDMIFLYRRPLLEYWCTTGEDPGHLVRHVMIHEISHHFRLSDDDMERIENTP